MARGSKRTRTPPTRVAATAKSDRGSAAPSKYDGLTVYDPATQTVRRSDGSIAEPETAALPKAIRPTLGSIAEMPGPLKPLERLYACETADEETVKMLAAVAGCAVSTLESRRLDYVDKTGVDCPRTTPYNRRRCAACPWWKLTDETPF